VTTAAISRGDLEDEEPCVDWAIDPDDRDEAAASVLVANFEPGCARIEEGAVESDWAARVSD
jgi:hypothetical protein